MLKTSQLLARACAAVALLSAGSAFAFGAQGHSTIGEIADRLLEGQRAQAELRRILGPVSMRDIAVWGDCVKGIDVYNDFKYATTGRFPECAPFENKTDEEALMRAYVQRNNEQCGPKPGEENCHKQYHYTNVALQRGRYQPGAVGTSDHDIVHAVKAATARLRGQPVPAPFSLETEREALALLVHALGDMHQPLHMGSIYLDEKGAQVDPDATGLDAQTHTVGGNALTLPNGQGGYGGNLHAYWDNLPNKLTPAELAALVEPARAVPASAGPVDGWAEAWAGESLLQARQSFEGMGFGPRAQSLRGPRWTVSLPEGYEARSVAQIRGQLIKGGARLAQLLRAIWPDGDKR